MPFGTDAGYSKSGFVQSDLHVLKTVVEQFRDDTGRLPTPAEGLDILLQQDNPRSAGQHYLRLDPIDPWGHRYRYQPNSDGIGFTVSSDGPDGIPGTRDDIALDSNAK